MFLKISSLWSSVGDLCPAWVSGTWINLEIQPTPIHFLQTSNERFGYTAIRFVKNANFRHFGHFSSYPRNVKGRIQMRHFRFQLFFFFSQIFNSFLSSPSKKGKDWKFLRGGNKWSGLQFWWGEKSDVAPSPDLVKFLFSWVIDIDWILKRPPR